MAPTGVFWDFSKTFDVTEVLSLLPYDKDRVGVRSASE